jgi:hypothetical protein
MEHVIGVVSLAEAPVICSSCGSAVPAGTAGCCRRRNRRRAWLCNTCLFDLEPLLALQIDAFTVLRGLGHLELEDVPVRDLWQLGVAIARAAERQWGPLGETVHRSQLIALGERATTMESQGDGQ